MNKQTTLAFAAFCIAILLYNVQNLFDSPNHTIFNVVVDGYQYVKIDKSADFIDPRKVHRCMINLAFAQAFLLMCWVPCRAFGVMAAVWFSIQAAEVYLTGNYFASDWPDWFTLGILFAAWFLWVKWEPIKERILRIAYFSDEHYRRK